MKKVRATKENMLKLFKERRRIYADRWRATRDTDRNARMNTLRKCAQWTL